MSTINITITCLDHDKVADALISALPQFVALGKCYPFVEKLKSPEGRNAIIEIISQEMNKHGKNLF